MKKQILAAAVAGAFAVPALAAADSSVTLFGQLQTQIVYHEADDLVELRDGEEFDDGFRVHDGGHVGRPDDSANANRIGVIVNHDLGAGMTALAKIEQNVATTTGIDSSARDVYVGLDTDFGRFLGGRMETPLKTAGRDPLNATFMQARTNGGRLPGFGGFGNGGYLDRVLRYANDVGPVGFEGAVILDNEDDSNTAFAALLTFDAGPAEIYGGYQHADEHEQAQDAFGDLLADPANQYVDDFHTAKIGADWSDGPFRVVGEIEDYRVKDSDGNSLLRGNTYFVSGTYTMGRNDFVLNLGFTDDDVVGETTYAAAAAKHHFSNRVMAYAGLVWQDFDAEDNGDEDGFAVGGGMRVSF